MCVTFDDLCHTHSNTENLVPRGRWTALRESSDERYALGHWYTRIGVQLPLQEKEPVFRSNIVPGRDQKLVKRVGSIRRGVWFGSSSYQPAVVGPG